MTKTESLRHLFGSKIAKIIPILLIVLMIGAASSTIYVYYIVNNTATVKTPDVQLVAGTDSTACSSTFPCATVTVQSTKDYATATFSLFPSNTNTPQPATYYTNFTVVYNSGTVAHTIKAIKLSGFSGLGNLGNITVDYCSLQTEFNANGTLVTPSNLVGSATITSSTVADQSVSGFGTGVSLAASGTGYIEIIAYASGAATAGSTVTFQISIQWL